MYTKTSAPFCKKYINVVAVVIVVVAAPRYNKRRFNLREACVSRALVTRYEMPPHQYTI